MGDDDRRGPVGVFLCRVQPFLAVVAVGSTPVPHPRRQCFSSEAVWSPKGTKMETVRVVEVGAVRIQNVWPGKLWWDCKPRTFQNHHRHPGLLLPS